MNEVGYFAYVNFADLFSEISAAYEMMVSGMSLVLGSGSNEQKSFVLEAMTMSEPRRAMESGAG